MRELLFDDELEEGGRPGVGELDGHGYGIAPSWTSAYFVDGDSPKANPVARPVADAVRVRHPVRLDKNVSLRENALEAGREAFEGASG